MSDGHEKNKCEACNKWMEHKKRIEGDMYYSRLQCPDCGFIVNVEVDMAEVQEMHDAIVNGPRGRGVVHLNSLKDLHKFKEYNPELADTSNAELAKLVKAVGMKWISREDYLMLMESLADDAVLYDLKVEVLKS